MKSHRFSEVVTDVTAQFTKIKASDYQRQGQYKIIDQGKGPVAGYTDDVRLVNGKLLPVVVFGDHTRALKYVDEPIALGADGAKALWVNPDLASARYVYYYLRSVQIKEAGYSRHFKFLKEVEIPIPFKDGAPDFDDQIRIAHLLGKVEGLIAQRKQHLQQLDDLLKSVFLEMFGDPVRNEKRWDKPALKAFGKISTGNTPPRNDPANYDGDFIEWIKTDNITGDAVFVTPAIEHLSEVGAKKARTVTNGALLVACIAGSVESIGRASLTDRTLSFNQQINAIQPGEDVNPLYLYGLFKLSRAYIQRHATKGMKKILTKGDFEKIKLIKPPIEIQNDFAVVVEKIEGIKSRYQQTLSDLEALYAALSHAAFKGGLDLSRVRVPESLAPNSNEMNSAQSLQPEAAALLLYETKILLAAIDDREKIKPMLNHWLGTYTEQLGEKAFSIDEFIREVKTRAEVTFPDREFDLGADAYDLIKAWVFDALRAGRLEQVYPNSDDDIRVALRKPRAAAEG
ncbi:restriction endonuclease subunit S [Simplicispira suum]|uniref:Type I restriction endonuclease n=1 Tax=Simplicispira suum TaxID=2109915 RepID=A0A2S0N2P5_9BURK|nr:restriction endonuclease subunit S [Simplicispira suum]AVO42405.1 type I restriction endonuclease [Simplicispira suum]